MPDMDGLEFTEELKKEDLIDGLPFLIVSAESERVGVT
jgi:CheY-like chemotaxis protein